jgi:hypothetical protein
LFEIIRIHDERNAYLPHIINAASLFGLLFRLGQSRQQHGGKNCDDRNHHQKFNQGKRLKKSSGTPAAQTGSELMWSRFHCRGWIFIVKFILSRKHNSRLALKIKALVFSRVGSNLLAERPAVMWHKLAT